METGIVIKEFERMLDNVQPSYRGSVLPLAYRLACTEGLYRAISLLEMFQNHDNNIRR